MEIPGEELFYSHVGPRGGPAPVRRFLPDLIGRVRNGRLDPDTATPRIALAAVVLGFLAITLDALVVNVALPGIRLHQPSPGRRR